MLPRPKSENPLFVMYEPEIFSKSKSGIERQRDADGTPITGGGRYRLSPPDIELTLNPALIKSSLAAEIKPKKSEEENPLNVIKAFVNGELEKACEPTKEESKVPGMLKSLESFAALCGYAKDND